MEGFPKEILVHVYIYILKISTPVVNQFFSCIYLYYDLPVFLRMQQVPHSIGNW